MLNEPTKISFLSFGFALTPVCIRKSESESLNQTDIVWNRLSQIIWCKWLSNERKWIEFEWIWSVQFERWFLATINNSDPTISIQDETLVTRERELHCSTSIAPFTWPNNTSRPCRTSLFNARSFAAVALQETVRTYGDLTPFYSYWQWDQSYWPIVAPR